MFTRPKTKEELASAWLIRVKTTHSAHHSGEGGYGGSDSRTETFTLTPDQILYENETPIGIRAFEHDFLFTSWYKNYEQYLDSWSDDEMDYSTDSETYLCPVVYDSALCPDPEALGYLYRHAGGTLTSLYIDGKTANIPDKALSGCTALKEVILADGVTTLGARGFALCTALAEISLPATLEEIGKDAFVGCSALRSVTVAEDSPYYYVKDGNLYDKRTEECLFSLANVSLPEDFKTREKLILPNGMTVIEERLFEKCEKLHTIVLPEGVTVIQSNAFRGCSALKTIVLPKSLRKIEDYAFSFCYELETLTLPEGVAEIGNNAFYCCRKLKEVTLSDSLSEIPEECFGDCSALEKVTFPKNLKIIGKSAFSHCEALSSVTLPDSLEEIGGFAFQYVPLSDVTFPKNLKRIGSSAFSNLNCDRLVLPEGLVEIGYSAFNGCKARTVVFPESLRELGSSAFEASALESVTLPKQLKHISSATFKNCIRLTEVILPETLTYIGKEAFNGCARLKSIHIPKTVTEIGSEPLNGCLHLRKISVDPENPLLMFRNGTLYKKGERYPETVFEMRKSYHDLLDRLPENYNEQEELKIPSGVSEVPPYLLSTDSKVRRLVFPKSVTYIGYNAFSEESSLEEVRFHKDAENVTFGFCAFSYCPSLKKITLPKNSTFYKGAFSENPSLKEVILPRGTKLKENNFIRCTSLERIVFEGETEYISNYAFYGCTSLKTVTLPEGLKGIQDCAFYGCHALEEIVFPASLNYIRSNSFANSGLRTVRFEGDSVYIDKYGVFKDCPLSEDGLAEIERVKRS